MNNSIKDHLPPCFCGLQNKLQQPTDFGLSHRKIEEDSNDKVFVVPVLMSLSKAFDTLNHEFLFADLYAFGFNRSPVKLTNDYLSFKQRSTTKIDNKDRRQRFLTIPDSLQEEKIRCNCLQIALSCPCTLLGTKFLKTLKISSSVKFQPGH